MFKQVRCGGLYSLLVQVVPTLQDKWNRGWTADVCQSLSVQNDTAAAIINTCVQYKSENATYSGESYMMCWHVLSLVQSLDIDRSLPVPRHSAPVLDVFLPTQTSPMTVPLQ